METVTISQLKNQLSAYLNKVRAGETVLIPDRDQPVARLERVPVEAGMDDRLLRLERQGLLRRARKPLDLDALRRNGPSSEKSVLEALIQDRREGR